MEWISLVSNVVAILAALAIYLWIMNSKIGEKIKEYQYAAMLFIILIACGLGFGMKFLLQVFL